MKQEEKTRITREKILHSALKEFGTKSYENASLNGICNESQIPKGLLYHNFKNKDDLYLQCVSISFQALTEYLKNIWNETKQIPPELSYMLRQRQIFFEDYPYYGNIFFYATLQPPAHLQEELLAIRSEFDTFCREYYTRLIESLPLRDGITTEKALKYILLFQELFNNYFQAELHKSQNFQNVVESHEINLSQIFDMILYGIACKKE